MGSQTSMQCRAMAIQTLVPSTLIVPSPAKKWHRSARASLLPTVAFSPLRGQRRTATGVCHVAVERSSLGVETRMKNFIEVEMKVRDYELDQFGVVNHANYINYCQHGRIELAKMLGFNPVEFSLSGDSLATTDIFVKFIAPLRAGDRFAVKLRISNTTAVRFIMEHFIFKLPNYEPILEAKATCVLLNKNYHLMRISPKVLSSIVLLDEYLGKRSDYSRTGEYDC